MICYTVKSLLIFFRTYPGPLPRASNTVIFLGPHPDLLCTCNQCMTYTFSYSNDDILHMLFCTLFQKNKSWRLCWAASVPLQMQAPLCSMLPSARWGVGGEGGLHGTPYGAPFPSAFQPWSAGGGEGVRRDIKGREESEVRRLPHYLPPYEVHPRLATYLHWALLPSRPPLSLQVVLSSWGGWEPADPNPRLQRSPLWVLLCLSTPLWLVPYKQTLVFWVASVSCWDCYREHFTSVYKEVFVFFFTPAYCSSVLSQISCLDVSNLVLLQCCDEWCF